MLSVLFNKIILCGLVLFYSLTGPVHSCNSKINLALGKPYSVSLPPSYALSAPPTDRASLTDGIYTSGYFWTQKTTVGWLPVKSVEIMIDLEKVSIIGSISFSTARGESAGVKYPVHISAFIGPDKDHFSYVGDVADTPDNKPGSYQTKRFVLEDVGVKGRYVLLVIQASENNSIFCDEIEVLLGNYDKGNFGNLAIEAARNLSEQTKRIDIGKVLLSSLAKKLSSIIDYDTLLKERFAMLIHRITTLQTRTDAETLETDILKFRGEWLRTQFPNEQFLLEPIGPWTSLSPIMPPSGVPLRMLSMVMPQGGYSHAAFLITNLMPEAHQIDLSIVKPATGAPKILLFHIPFVQSAAMEYVADPLVPIRGPLILRSGESRMFFLSTVGENTGNWKGTVNVTSDNSFRKVVPVEMSVLRTKLTKDFTLNAVNWGYLDFNLIKSIKSLATNDLLSHHTNVLVVPLTYLPGANQVMPVDLSRLGSYLKQHKGVTKLLFDTGLGDAKHKTVTAKDSFMSKQWQENFKRWYENAARVAAAAGFTSQQIYLYPYDEMDGQQVDDFIKLSTWAKKEIPGIQFYATINNKRSLKSLPYLDVAQIANNSEVLAALGETKAEIWIYDSKSPAKSQSPYSYYRLMAWKAFLKGYKGIGFWAYADTGWGDNTGTAWDDFDGVNPDYAVIYEGEGNTIISSRRWEGWRMGIEDYELLTMYAKDNGETAAKALAKSVLDASLDSTKADEVRQKILLGLSR